MLAGSCEGGPPASPLPWEWPVALTRLVTPENPSARIPDAEVPWWAVSMLPYTNRRGDRSTKHLWRVRHFVERGAWWLHSKELAPVWEDIVCEALQMQADCSLDEMFERARKDVATRGCERRRTKMRTAALRSVRAFVQMIGLTDEEGNPIVMKDFHCRTVQAERQQELAVILLPFQHGKSFLSSMVVPLMDWAENAESTQGRIYYNTTFTTLWTRRLMHQVETNERLQFLFPWVRKPEKGDPAYGIWGVENFAIGGKRDPSPSFTPLTVGSSTTGTRFWRTICDDWVNERNASSPIIQDQYYNYLKSGAMTMRKRVQLDRKALPPWVPFHGDEPETKWGTLALSGTVFTREDVNFRAYTEWKKQGRKVIKVDCFLGKKENGEVIWPEYRPLEYILQLEKELGRRAFEMRCRNLVRSEYAILFKAEDVEDACAGDWVWGDPPSGARLLIGFDPASGKTVKRDVRFPAVALYGEVDDHVHVVKWGRWDGWHMPRQVDALIDLARQYHCAIAVEDNQIQSAYADWIRQHAQDVEVITHTTTANRKDGREGIESLIPLFEQRVIHIHSVGAPADQLKAIKDEFVNYPNWRYTDILMSLWIARYQHRLRSQQGVVVDHRELPNYVSRRGRSYVIDLKKIRGGRVSQW